MPLVEPDYKQPTLNLRVFKRSPGRLVLLWNRTAEISEKRPKISAKSLDDAQNVDVREFALSPESEVGKDVGDDFDPNTVICVIDTNRNGLDDKTNYYFTVEYVGTDVRQCLRVHKAGVLPDHEKEERSKNFHNFLWDGERQQWRKWHGVMSETRFYAGVVMVPCPSCGFDPAQGSKDLR